MAQYIIHAAPYSSPNTRKNIRSNYKVQNLRVFQENPRAGGGVFAQFDLVNPNNPKDKTYHMNFSFADGTSMTANAINRIRRFFNEAYDRQRSSSYGFPQLSDTEKTQIIARINTAYNQFAGFSHSDSEDGDIIDCTGDEHLEHVYSAANSFIGNPNVNGPNSKVLRMSFDKSSSSLHDNKNGLSAALHFELTGGYGTNPNGTNAFGVFVDYDPRYYNDLKHYERKVREQLSFQNGFTNEWTVSPVEITKAAQFAVDAFKRYRLSKAHSQHEGYYSPNFKHSEPDYLSVKMSAIDDLDDNYLEHHGILGMKWGIRRYQNADGSLTPEGKVRYGSQMAKALQKGDQKSYDKIRSKIKEGSDNDLLEKVANQLNDSGKKASKKNYSDALKKTEAEALENKRKEYAKVVKEKVESGKNGGSDAGLYAEYHDNLYDEEKFHGKRTTEEEYKKNGYMSNAERQTFNYAEKECQRLSDDKKDAFLRGISSVFDGSVRDNPSVLVWDNKKNKIVAYPSSYEFERVPDFDKYRDAWTSGNTIWLYTWGEQYDG